jgi:hypothetical protein
MTARIAVRTGLYGKDFSFFLARPVDVLAAVRQTRGRKFDETLILGTTGRCGFGLPRVLVCAPFHASAPFPTTFWLTCPRLVRLAGEAESRGGVGELEHWIERHAPREWIPFNIAHQRLRLSLLPDAAQVFLRRFRPRLFGRVRGVGVGGLRYGAAKDKSVRVKCLHLQLASWLALGRHPGAEWLAGRFGEACDKPCSPVPQKTSNTNSISIGR